MFILTLNRTGKNFWLFCYLYCPHSHFIFTFSPSLCKLFILFPIYLLLLLLCLFFCLPHLVRLFANWFVKPVTVLSSLWHCFVKPVTVLLSQPVTLFCQACDTVLSSLWQFCQACDFVLSCCDTVLSSMRHFFVKPVAQHPLTLFYQSLWLKHIFMKSIPFVFPNLELSSVYPQGFCVSFLCDLYPLTCLAQETLPLSSLPFSASFNTTIDIVLGIIPKAKTSTTARLSKDVIGNLSNSTC